MHRSRHRSSGVSRPKRRLSTTTSRASRPRQDGGSAHDRLRVEVSEGRSESIQTLRNFFPDFPQQFERLLREKQLGLIDVANATGLSRPTLARIASGSANPLVGNIIKIAFQLGTTIAELLGAQAGALELAASKDQKVKAFFASPPHGDPAALRVYEKACGGAELGDLYKEVDRLRYRLPDEPPEASVSRAILDVFHHQRAWIDPLQLRDENNVLEKNLSKRYRLPVRNELADPWPVRVLDTSMIQVPLLHVHAVAAMMASLIKELLRRYTVLGFADGFLVSTVQRFLRRGDLIKADVVSMVHNPKYVQFELSGVTLIGSLARTHLEYRLNSNVALRDLPQQVKRVEVAVTSCGTNVYESQSRISRLVREASVDRDYAAFIETLKQEGVVGDLYYHFLDAKGNEIPKPEVSMSIDKVDPRHLAAYEEGGPMVYSPSLECLAGIAQRGVVILGVHSPNRARLAHAALSRDPRPVNFLVATKEAAQEMLDL